MDSGPDLIGALSPDRELARNAAFALYELLWLEATGALPRRLSAAHDVPQVMGGGLPGPDLLAETLSSASSYWPHMFPYFTAHDTCDKIAGFAQGAWQQLFGWMRHQPLSGTEPQALYEIGLMVLGVAIPAVDIGTIRDLQITRQTNVLEWPNAGGYPTLLVAAFHLDWFAASRVRLYVKGAEATALASWALTVLSGHPDWPSSMLIRVGDMSRDVADPKPDELLLNYRLHESLVERLSKLPAHQLVYI